MPPKPKFEREEIIEAALSLVSECGIDALTTRTLGDRLQSSARPIFTVFKNMDELQSEVRAAAMKKFERYVEESKLYTPVFKQVGMQMIRFATEEPKLYQLLFMKEAGEIGNFHTLYHKLGSVADICIQAVQTDYGLNEQEANVLFESLWIYTYGIGALCATNMCRFSEKEIGNMLGTEFLAIMSLIKSGNLHIKTPFPVRNPSAAKDSTKES